MMSSNQIFKISKGEKFRDIVSGNLKNSIIAAKLKGKLYDLSDTSPEDGNVEFISMNSPEGEKILLHSAAHLLANAIVELYPDALPNTSNEGEDTFYYDFNMQPISTEDFPAIEQKMDELVHRDIKIERKILPKLNLLEEFSGNKYKQDKIN